MTKAKLMKVRRLAVEIAQQEEYLIELRGLRNSMENQLRQGRSATISRRVEAMVIKIVAAEERLQWLLERQDEAKVELREEIKEAVADSTLRRLLILRYVQCWTWTQIAKEMQCSRQWLHLLHKKYLASLALHVKV